MENLKVSKEELKLILEALLFSSSVDVCSEWYKEDIENVVDLCKKIRLSFPDVPVDNVYVSHFENYIYSDEYTKPLLNFFPELNNKNKKTL